MRVALLILHVARAVTQHADDASSMLQVLKRTERLMDESVDGVYEDEDCTSGKCKPKCPVMDCLCLEGQEHFVSQDEHGCNICECQGEPCQQPACEECPLAQKLIIGKDNRGCETCSCEGTLCPLELPACSCPPGQDAVVNTDQNGCDTCGCEGEVCKEPKRTCAQGQELVCQTNEKGCEICNCEGPICPLTLPVCNCLTGQKRVNIKDQQGCDSCECQGVACAEPNCPAKCPFAQKLVFGKDSRQCETCACQGKICPKKECNCKLGQKLATGTDAHGCETCSCTGTPCATPRCTACPKAQQLKMKKDNRGCDTCSCTGHICGPVRPGSCQKGQTRQTKTLPNGCQDWFCTGEPCRKPACKACPLVQKLKLQKDSRGCDTCSCEGVKCPVPNCKCSNNGYQKLWQGKSSNGCPICKCVDVECESCDLEKLCNDAITLKHDARNLVINNLGGFGPNNKFAKEMRFKDATRYQGKIVDLVVVAKAGTGYTAVDQYAAIKMRKADPSYIYANGALGDFGTINLLAPEGKSMKPTFTFNFVESNTNKPVVLPSVMFTFFDLDQGKNQGPGGEEITTCDADDVVTAVGTQLKMIKKGGKCRVVQSTQNKIVNVQNKDAMTASQKKNSVVMQFTKKSSFDIQFFSRKGNRNFLFMAHPTFVCPGKKHR